MIHDSDSNNCMHMSYKYNHVMLNLGEMLTFKPLSSSFPARAKSKVDLPDPGGPKSNVILEIKNLKIKL